MISYLKMENTNLTVGNLFYYRIIKQGFKLHTISLNVPLSCKIEWDCNSCLKRP